MSQGRFIVLEGGEGVGKTTLAKKLKERLDPARFVFTREPGGTPFAEEMRKIIFANNDDPFKELCLFFAARRDHILKFIRPALEAGKHVISDRYVGSTFAYQIVAPKRPYLQDCFGTMVKFAEAHPDVYSGNVLVVNYLWLDGDVAVCLGRRKASGDVNSFDERSFEFHYGVRKGFTRFFEDKYANIIHFGSPSWVKIDAELPEEEVFEKAVAAIEEITRDRRKS